MQWLHVRHEEVARCSPRAKRMSQVVFAVCAGKLRPGNLHLLNGLFDCHRSRCRVVAIGDSHPSP